MMHTDALLRVARDIIAKVPACMAITVDQNGDANARVVNPKPLSEAWTVRFATDRRSRKSAEIEQSGRLTLAYQYDAGKAYVSLIEDAPRSATMSPPKPPIGSPSPTGGFPAAPPIRTSSMWISSRSASNSGVRHTVLSLIRCAASGLPPLPATGRAGSSRRHFPNQRSRRLPTPVAQLVRGYWSAR